MYLQPKVNALWQSSEPQMLLSLLLLSNAGRDLFGDSAGNHMNVAVHTQQTQQTNCNAVQHWLEQYVLWDAIFVICTTGWPKPCPSICLLAAAVLQNKKDITFSAVQQVQPRALLHTCRIKEFSSSAHRLFFTAELLKTLATAFYAWIHAYLGFSASSHMQCSYAIFQDTLSNSHCCHA